MLSAATAPTGKTKRGFEALAVFNYFEAKDLFYDALKRDSLGAAYGLSIIYARNDNPFYQPDSAFRFINIAGRNLSSSYPPDSLKYQELGLTPNRVGDQLRHVDSLFFEFAQDANTLETWNNFLKDHRTEPFAKTALELRNNLAYRAAVEAGMASDFVNFIETYPDAAQLAEAKSNYEAALYSEATAIGNVGSFSTFIANYPSSPYIVDAENQIFKYFDAKNDPNELLQFIRQFTQNRNVNEAWRKIYLLEIKQFDPRAIAAFTLKYSDYPFLEELQNDFSFAVTRFYPVKVGDRYGFIDEAGAMRIEPKYDWVEPFIENISLVGLDNRVAFLKKDGKLITGFTYDDGFSFREGFAVVERDGKYGLINRFGEEIIPAAYEELGEMSEGLIYLERDGLLGYANETGELVIDFQFEAATDFKNGLAVVGREGRQGFIDRNGEPISDFRWDWIEPLPENGVAARARANKMFGLINRLGNAVLDTLYEQIGEFHEGFALAAQDGAYGFIDERGRLVTESKYTYSSKALTESYFNNGYAKVFQDEKVGLIDSTGRKVLPAMFEDIRSKGLDRFAAKKKGKWGFVDATNKVWVDFKYEEAAAFEDSVAIVKMKGRFFLIDWKEKGLSDKYLQLDRVGNLIYGGDTTLALISKKGEPITPFIYAEIKVIDDKVVALILPSGYADYFDRSRGSYLWKHND